MLTKALLFPSHLISHQKIACLEAFNLLDVGTSILCKIKYVDPPMTQDKAYAVSCVRQKINRMILFCVWIEDDPRFFQNSFELPSYYLRCGQSI